MSRVVGRASLGFTLVEVLVATALMALALLAIADIFPVAMFSEKKAAYLAAARMRAHSEIDVCRATKFNGLKTETTVTSDSRLPEGNTVTVEISSFPTSSDADLKKINVKVDWPGEGVPWLGGQVEHETLISRN